LSIVDIDATDIEARGRCGAKAVRPLHSGLSKRCLRESLIHAGSSLAYLSDQYRSLL